MNKTQTEFYSSPEIEVVETKVTQVLCSSLLLAPMQSQAGEW